MSDGKPQPPAKPARQTDAQERADRLVQALRANLKRRKAVPPKDA